MPQPALIPCRHKASEPGCLYCGLAESEPRLAWAWAGGRRSGLPPPSNRFSKRIAQSQHITSYGGPGTELKVLLASFGLAPNGCKCDARAAEMDRWGVAGCNEHREEILAWLREEQGKRGWTDYLLAAGLAAKEYAAGAVKTVILPYDPAPGLLDEALRRAEAKETLRREEEAARKAAEEERAARERAKSLPIEVRVVDNVSSEAVEPRKEGSVGNPPTGGLTWRYGVTTVAERRNDLLPKTLRSLAGAGFPEPVLFVDGASHEEAAGWEREFGLPVVARRTQIKTFGNWTLGLAELYLRDPHADRYAMFQDDFVTYRNLKEYLERVPFPERGYLNLMLWGSNEKLAPRDKQGNPVTGFFPSNQLGRGAVALVFDNEGVVQLLTHEHTVRRPKDKERGWKAIDGGIVTALAKAGYKEFVHYPTLLHHTGVKSAMGNRRHPDAVGWKGETFDALKLLNK